MQTDRGKLGEKTENKNKKKNQEKWEKLCCWLHSDLICPRLLNNNKKKNNPSVFFWTSIFQRLRFLLSHAERESWEDVRYPRTSSPPGTGSWRSWELSMDRGWWEPSCWWWSRCSWGPGCYCSNPWDPFCLLRPEPRGACFPGIPSPPSLFHSSGSGCHHRRPTPPSPCAPGKGVFVPPPLARPFYSSCAVRWSRSFCLRSLQPARWRRPPPCTSCPSLLHRQRWAVGQLGAGGSEAQQGLAPSWWSSSG